MTPTLPLLAAARRLTGAVPAGVVLRALLLVLLVLVLNAPASAQRDIDAEAREISKGLRCEVCQNLSVNDSNSDLAVEMRAIIRDQLSEGKSRQEIEAYFVQRYGDRILLDPPKQGLFNLLVWGGPVLVLILGMALLVLALSRWTRAKPERDPLPEPTQEDLDRYDVAFKDELHRHDWQRSSRS